MESNCFYKPKFYNWILISATKSVKKGPPWIALTYITSKVMPNRIKVPDFSRNSCQFDSDRTLIGILQRMWIIVRQTFRIKADEHNILQEFQSEKQMTSPIEKCHIEKWVRQRALTMQCTINQTCCVYWSHIAENLSQLVADQLAFRTHTYLFSQWVEITSKAAVSSQCP